MPAIAIGQVMQTKVQTSRIRSLVDGKVNRKECPKARDQKACNRPYRNSAGSTTHKVSSGTKFLNTYLFGKVD
jgi:hypothetical protein